MIAADDRFPSDRDGVEIWKPVPGYVGRYEVSDLGRVRRCGRYIICGEGRRYIRTKILAQDIGGRANNYRRVNLMGPKRHAYVHHLVLEAFVGERPIDMLGCHRNDDGFDNALTNLYWGTEEDNAANKARNRQPEPALAGVGDDDGVPF